MAAIMTHLRPCSQWQSIARRVGIRLDIPNRDGRLAHDSPMTRGAFRGQTDGWATPPRWIRGCGQAVIADAVLRVLNRLHFPKATVIIVIGFGAPFGSSPASVFVG